MRGVLRRRVNQWVVRSLNALGFDLTRSPVDGRISVIRDPMLSPDPNVAMRTIVGESASVVVDVGAHQGSTSVRFAETFPEARIFALEPDPENFAILVRQVRSVKRIVPIGRAAAERTGPATLYRTRFDQAHSLRRPAADAPRYLASGDLLEEMGPVPIETISLDDFCVENGLDHIDVLKIDAQGSELEILEGGKGLFSRGAATLVFLEVNFLPVYDGMALFPAVYQWLFDRGYRLVQLYDTAFRDRFFQIGCNALFVLEEKGSRRAAGGRSPKK